MAETPQIKTIIEEWQHAPGFTRYCAWSHFLGEPCGACAVREVKPKLCACGHPATDHAPRQVGWEGQLALCGPCAKCVGGLVDPGGKECWGFMLAPPPCARCGFGPGLCSCHPPIVIPDRFKDQILKGVAKAVQESATEAQARRIREGNEAIAKAAAELKNVIFKFREANSPNPHRASPDTVALEFVKKSRNRLLDKLAEIQKFAEERWAHMDTIRSINGPEAAWEATRYDLLKIALLCSLGEE